MRHAVAIGLAGLVSCGVVWAVAPSAVAASAKGVVTLPASHIAAVEVTEHDAKAPPAFADQVRDDTQKEAALFGADGAGVTLRIEIDSVHFKNPMRAMLIGDENVAQGRVTVVDAATGQVLGTFKLWVTAERPNAGMRVLSAIDPTGLVAMSQAMGNTNASKEEVVMAENFAQEVLRQTYGDARTRAAHAAVRSAAPVAAAASAQPAGLVGGDRPAQAVASSQIAPGGPPSNPAGLTTASWVPVASTVPAP